MEGIGSPFVGKGKPRALLKASMQQLMENYSTSAQTS